MPVLGTPPANLGMGLAEMRIRAEVRGRHHVAGGQLRAMNAVIASKPFRYLRPDLNQACVQKQGDMASWTRETGRANERPDFAARSRNELRQLLRLHAASDYGGDNRHRIHQFDLVRHTVVGIMFRISYSRQHTTLARPQTAVAAVSWMRLIRPCRHVLMDCCGMPHPVNNDSSCVVGANVPGGPAVWCGGDDGPAQTISRFDGIRNSGNRYGSSTQIHVRPCDLRLSLTVRDGRSAILNPSSASVRHWDNRHFLQERKLDGSVRHGRSRLIDENHLQMILTQVQRRNSPGHQPIDPKQRDHSQNQSR
jgi:hypothetical protein